MTEGNAATDWRLIRDVLNSTIDACERLEALAVTAAEKGDPRARLGDYEDGVAVGDFFTRFWQYPEGAQRDILRIRSRLHTGDQKHYSEYARALINTAMACAEAIGLSREELRREIAGFDAHCPSAGTSVVSQLTGIGDIYRKWMVPGITKAITEHRERYPAEQTA